MAEKGVDWDFGGEQLTYGWALAVCYHVGWRKGDLRKAAALMTSESQRWTRAWHRNLDPDGTLLSTDWGLFQINDKWHPDFEMPAGFNAIYNARYAFEMYENSWFFPWAAFNSGAYKKYIPAVWIAWFAGRWRNKIERVEKRWG